MGQKNCQFHELAQDGVEFVTVRVSSSDLGCVAIPNPGTPWELVGPALVIWAAFTLLGVMVQRFLLQRAEQLRLKFQRANEPRSGSRKSRAKSVASRGRRIPKGPAGPTVNVAIPNASTLSDKGAVEMVVEGDDGAGDSELDARQRVGSLGSTLSGSETASAAGDLAVSLTQSMNTDDVALRSMMEFKLSEVAKDPICWWYGFIILFCIILGMQVLIESYNPFRCDNQLPFHYRGKLAQYSLVFLTDLCTFLATFAAYILYLLTDVVYQRSSTFIRRRNIILAGFCIIYFYAVWYLALAGQPKILYVVLNVQLGLVLLWILFVGVHVPMALRLVVKPATLWKIRGATAFLFLTLLVRGILLDSVVSRCHNFLLIVVESGSMHFLMIVGIIAILRIQTEAKSSQ
jgi:hypothetical protein